MTMNIPFAKMNSWQEDMRVDGLRGCMICLGEAIKQGYLCETEFFCYDMLVFNCPRHNAPTLAWREFFIEFAKVLDQHLILSHDCSDPAGEIGRVMNCLKNYYESGMYNRVQRAHIPRRA